MREAFRRAIDEFITLAKFDRLRIQLATLAAIVPRQQSLTFLRVYNFEEINE